MNHELSALELSVNQLVERHRHALTENASLRRELEALRADNRQLQAKIERTATRLEQVLQRLPEGI